MSAGALAKELRELAATTGPNLIRGERVVAQKGALGEASRREAMAEAARESRRRMLLQTIESEPTEYSSLSPSSGKAAGGAAGVFPDSEQLIGPRDDDLDMGLLNPTPSKKQRLASKQKKGREAGRAVTWLQAIEEVRKNEPLWVPTFLTAALPPSSQPARRFCLVCGFFAEYNCVRCSTPFCSIPCLDTHKDTRCLKWSA
ncbi:MAG: zinc finger HIT domain-containing protein [archaeon]|nr:zinc finger HIT domain-containing protein [archaeon]